MSDHVQHLHARLRSYVNDGDHAAVTDAEAVSLLGWVETRLLGREPQTPVDLATLLAQFHLARYQVLPPGDDYPDLTAAVRWYRRVLRTHPDRVPAELRELFDNGDFGPDEPEFVDPDLLADAELEDSLQQLEALAADGNPRWQAMLAAFRSTAYERFGHEADLRGAIDLARTVLGHPSASPSEKQAARTNLASALLNRFARFTDRDALDEAVALYEQAVTERGTAADHANAGMAYLTRFEVTAVLTDLAAAVRHAREAVRGTAEEDPWYPARLSNLAGAMRALYDETGDDDHLDDALRCAERAVRASPPDDPAYARRLANLCAALSTRFEKHGAVDDIDRAIEAGRASVASGPSSGAPGRVSNLLLALHLRGATTGTVADLQEALRLGRTVAAALPEDHADRPDILTNAAGAAMTWFDWTGDIAAINDAVELSREAVRTLGDGGRAGLMHTNLSMHLLTRFEVTGDAADVTDAVRHAELGAEDARGPAVAIAQSNLALALRTRYETGGEPRDLERALVAARAALEGMPQHRDRPAMESNLSLCLWQAGQRVEALERARAALDDPAAAGTPSRAAYAANVARMLTELGGRPEEVAALWGSVSRDGTAPVPLRIEAYVAAARLPGAAPRAIADDLAHAVELLPAAAWHGVGVPSRLRRLGDWQGIGPDAAAAALITDGPERALRLLEAALAHLWEREVPAPGEDERLRRTRPDLATKLGQLREALSR